MSLIASTTLAVGQEYYSPNDLSFTVYDDGYVVVDYTVDVDPTMVRVNVSLPGSLYQNLLILDQDLLILDSTPTGDGLTIDTLAAISASIWYETTDLTGKAGQIWTFAVSTPINSTILLPEGSTIISLSDVPLEMGSLAGRVLLTMPLGDLEISYTVGVVGSREHALAIINDAEDTIEAIQATGVITPDADDLLERAYSAYDAGQYAGAEQLAAQAKSSAEDTAADASAASVAIDNAISAISDADEDERTEGLAAAQDKLGEAESSYALGDYTEALELAEEAQDLAESATRKSSGSNMLLYAGLVVAAGGVGAAYMLMGRPKKAPEVQAVSFDLDRLFREHPNLRMDDKEVIRFLAQNRGETFAAEVRDRFDIPRTSLWRMIRRLEGEGVIEVATVGGQSLVRLDSRYKRGGAGE
ncbi:hypothetical protein ISS40_01735 [Candidatus Bathyarchaeota archaeon]|nr:hypothetical protein [Candidatus Bathyarchaeota archaeon]